FRDKADLDLAGMAGIALELPVRADVPAEHDPVGWVVGQDSGPVAFAPVLGAVEDVPADPRFERGAGDRRAEEVVLLRFEVAEALHERREGAGDRRVDDDLSAD